MSDAQEPAPSVEPSDEAKAKANELKEAGNKNLAGVCIWGVSCVLVSALQVMRGDARTREADL